MYAQFFFICVYKLEERNHKQEVPERIEQRNGGHEDKVDGIVVGSFKLSQGHPRKPWPNWRGDKQASSPHWGSYQSIFN